MKSSDDDAVFVPRTVSDYYFVNDEHERVAFSELPLQWKANEQLDGNRKAIFLGGKANDGLQEIFIRVTAWRFDLSYVNPEISVLSKDRVWINLQKPMKSFVSLISTILIMIRCLHYVKRNPEISDESLWKHLSTIFSAYEVRPSHGVLADHTFLISEAVKRDENLRKAKVFAFVLDEKLHKKKKDFDEDVGNIKPGFMIDGCDDLCSICDDGGEVLSCKGRCMRSFHATVEAGKSMCESLGLSHKQVKAIENFVCKNCLYKQHQCFVCGELGSSDESSGAEVFSCVSATCGRFYHPCCVARLLHRDNAVEVEELQKKIADGESFTCPIHKCFLCKLGEDKTDRDLQFAVCRRCPKSFHRKCLPREIGFEDDKENGITQRAWEIGGSEDDEENGVEKIPDHILIYCLEHEIDEKIGTPVRNHIQIPDDECKKKKPATEQHLSKGKVPVKQSIPTPEGVSRKRHREKSQKGVGISSSIKESESSTGNERSLSVPASSKKPKVADSSSVKKSLLDKNVPPVGETLHGFANKSIDEETPKDEQDNAMTEKPIAQKLDSSVQLDADAKKRILAVMEDVKSSITMEHILAKHSVPSTHVPLSRNGVDKTVMVGKVEGSVEAIQVMQKLEKGCSIDDAKAVCEPRLLLQIDRRKIVDMLQHYVQDDDTIVEFGCGSNDFSCLMGTKLDEVGKKCSYKNYDILQAETDLNFEKRDLKIVPSKKLSLGSQLILVLNPPSGLANKFINKALEFKPKLMVLIVLKTERLDINGNSYNLIWEDDVLLAGKSYLPGSVEVNANQIEDWNVNASRVCVWSHPSWTAKHKAIARQHGPISMLQELGSPYQEDSCKEQPISDNPLEDNDHDRNDVSEQLQEIGSRPFRNSKEVPAHRIVHHGHSGHRKDKYNKSARKWNRYKEKPQKPHQGLGEESQKCLRGQNSASKRCHRSSDHCSRSEVAMKLDLPSDQRLGASRSNFDTGHRGPTGDHDIGGSCKKNVDFSSVTPNRRTSDTNLRPRNSMERSTLRSGSLLGELEGMRNLDFTPSYGHHLSSAANTSYGRFNLTFAVQRQSGELNHMTNSSMPEPMPSMPGPKNGLPHSKAAPHAGYHINALGFALGPNRSYSQHSSSGWLNE